ncbi:hypothetical protein JCM11491_005071 [Sporobolomyces phaffii]
MARFGLLDSDDEASDASSSVRPDDEADFDGGDSTARSISVPPLSEDEDDDDDDDDAPPRASLLSDDDGDDLESEQDDAEDYSMDEHSRSRSRSYSATPSLPPPARRKPQLQLGGSVAQQQQQSPWAQQLKLEPKRVQVMQASFFGQAASSRDVDVARERERERDESDQERLGKRRATQLDFSQRAAAPAPLPPPSLQQSQPSQPVPTPVVDPAPFRPYRTYSRIPLQDSITRDAENSLADAGLGLGRSYRVGWGSAGELVTLDVGKGKSDVINIDKVKLVSEQDKTSSLRLLELQLTHTEIFPSSHTDPSSSSPVPFASPLPSLRFSHFSQLFTSSSSSTSDSSSSELENSREAQFFKLASHLFDEVPDLSLSPNASPSYVSTVTALRRRNLLSTWLSSNLLPTISHQLHDPAVPAMTKIFLLLSTHQLAAACDLALESSNLRLATLISQLGTVSASGTDRQFQRDLVRQVEKWNEYKVDSHVSVGVRKVYEVLSGNLGTSKGRDAAGREDESAEFHVLDAVEWKAAFAMGLWYARHEEAADGPETDEVESAVRRYERQFTAASNPRHVARPVPSYVATSTSASPSSSTATGPLDPIYHLLKLYTSATHSLEESLSPLNFGPHPTDYRLPWHLYLMFSRVLRRRDFEDRLELDRSDDDMREGEGAESEGEGNSVRADQVTTSYASQLESLGCWEWSVFVLLHLELEAPRAQAIQQVLTRHVTSLTPTISSFLVDTLKLPRFYLDRARATHAQSIGDVFGTYKHLLSAQEPSQAHTIAVEELCPEAIVRGDEGLLKRLLEPFREDRDDGDEDEAEGEFRGTVAGWEQGGKIYLEYLHTLSLFSNPRTATLATSHAYLARTVRRVQAYSQQFASVPRLSDNLKLRMAMNEMSSRLNVLSRAVGGTALSVTRPSLLGESDKLVWLQGATESLFKSSLAKATASAAAGAGAVGV